MKLREMVQAGESLRSPASPVSELLLGAHPLRGRAQTEAISLAEEIETFPIRFETAAEAARIGARFIRTGKSLPIIDVLFGAAARSANLAL